MEKLVFNDGTVLPDCSAIAGGNEVFLYLQGVTFPDAFRLITERGKMRRFAYHDSAGVKTEYAGFTRPVALRDEDNGLITAVMRRADNV